MRRWSVVAGFVLAVVLAMSMVATAGAAPKHDKTVFKKRFLQYSNGNYFGKRMDLGTSWKKAGRDLKFWGEIVFKDDASGRFDIFAETTWDESTPGVPQSTKVGTGRAYVTDKTVVLSFKSLKANKAWFKLATKRIASGKKYYYQYGADNLRLYKTKNRFYKAFKLGTWG